MQTSTGTRGRGCIRAIESCVPGIGPPSTCCRHTRPSPPGRTGCRRWVESELGRDRAESGIRHPASGIVPGSRRLDSWWKSGCFVHRHPGAGSGHRSGRQYACSRRRIDVVDRSCRTCGKIQGLPPCAVGEQKVAPSLIGSHTSQREPLAGRIITGERLNLSLWSALIGAAGEHRASSAKRSQEERKSRLRHTAPCAHYIALRNVRNNVAPLPNQRLRYALTFASAAR